MGTPRTIRSALWNRDDNSLIFFHVSVSTGVIGSPETPLYLALIASASNSGSCSCQISNLSTVTSPTCSLHSERNALTIAVEADFSFRGEVTMFKIRIFVALLSRMYRYGAGIRQHVPYVFLSPHAGRPAASRISCVISSG